MRFPTEFEMQHPERLQRGVMSTRQSSRGVLAGLDQSLTALNLLTIT